MFDIHVTLDMWNEMVFALCQSDSGVQGNAKPSKCNYCELKAQKSEVM